MRLPRWIVALLLLCSTAAALAQPLTVEDLFRQPAYANPVLSDNGKYFAATAPINGKMNVVVIDLETRKADALTNFRDFDVIDLDWVGNDRLVFSLGQANSPTGPGQFEGGGLFMVSRDAKEFRRISPTVREARAQNQFVYRGYNLLRSVPGSDEEVIATGNLRDVESLDIYRLNVKTGRATLAVDSRPTRTTRWILDRNLVPRVTVAWIKDTLTYVVYWRKDDKSPWEELTRYDGTKGPTFVPLVFEDDNETLQVAYNAGRDTMAVYRYHPAQRKLGELIAQHPRYDMGADGQGERVAGVITDPKTRKVVGYSVNADRPQTVWIDDGYERIQKMIDGALPGMRNTFFRTPDGKRLVVTSYSDRKPRSWYLLDEEKRTLEELFSSRPWIKPGQPVEQRSFTYKTRDGLEIPGYYFLPANYKPGQKLPTIVHIHGGPTVRADTWGNGFGVLEGQLFASRGYAVLVPNFRSTPGLGGRIYYAGFGSLGKQMVDDHEDATRWAIEQGFADPERICMSGASYGGYATLMSLARFPKLFKCGVAGLVVSDWQLMATSSAGDTADSPAVVSFVNALVGAASPSAYPPEISPVNLADRIKQPILFYAGADDIRTPIEQTNRMVRALERAGNKPRAVIVKNGEGHGFGKLENNVDLYKQVFEFLDSVIGPKSKPAPG